MDATNDWTKTALTKTEKVTKNDGTKTEVTTTELTQTEVRKTAQAEAAKPGRLARAWEWARPYLKWGAALAVLACAATHGWRAWSRRSGSRSHHPKHVVVPTWSPERLLELGGKLEKEQRKPNTAEEYWSYIWKRLYDRAITAVGRATWKAERARLCGGAYSDAANEYGEEGKLDEAQRCQTLEELLGEDQGDGPPKIDRFPRGEATAGKERQWESEAPRDFDPCQTVTLHLSTALNSPSLLDHISDTHALPRKPLELAGFSPTDADEFLGLLRQLLKEARTDKEEQPRGLRPQPRGDGTAECSDAGCSRTGRARGPVPKGRQWVAGGFSRRNGAHTQPSPEGRAEAHGRRRGARLCRPFGTSRLPAQESGG
ncbi:MAG: hypothetical protein FJ291_07755 [Planctomycetes bacterium]|nr:hypothetical protein [Planctomycetota bacterium]